MQTNYTLSLLFLRICNKSHSTKGLTPVVFIIPGLKTVAIDTTALKIRAIKNKNSASTRNYPILSDPVTIYIIMAHCILLGLCSYT